MVGLNITTCISVFEILLKLFRYNRQPPGLIRTGQASVYIIKPGSHFLIFKPGN